MYGPYVLFFTFEADGAVSFRTICWDASQQNWAGAEICATPERMRDLLLDDLACYLEYKVTLCNRPLEDTERQMIQRQVAEMESSFR